MMAILKLFAFLAVCSAGACGFGTLCTAAYLYSGGIASVDIETPDTDLYLPVPLRLADVGLGVARIAGVEREWDDSLDAETRARLEEMQPMIRQLVDELGSLPSGDLVRVENGDELVLIRSKRGRLLVDVTTDDSRVRISVPQRAARRVTRQALALADL